MQKLLLFFFICLLANCTINDKTEIEKKKNNRELDFTAQVSFYSSDSEQLISTIDVVIADDDDSRSEGLMNVHELPADAGMLFMFENEQPRSFWMANTPLSLDIMFVNSDLEIVRIHRNTTPYSHDQIRSELPAKYVVEVNAGYSVRHDITEGMIISVP